MGKKSEQREKRKAEKQRPNKKVPAVERATTKKEPRDEPLAGINSPVWSFVLLDADGPWCWSVMTGAVLLAVLKSLKGFERFTWSELKGQGSHPVAKDKLIKGAQDQLAKLKLDDIDELYSLRISGIERIWGIKQGDWLRILWWDPEHKICPSLLKNT